MDVECNDYRHKKGKPPAQEAVSLAENLALHLRNLVMSIQQCFFFGFPLNLRQTALVLRNRFWVDRLITVC